MSNADMDLWTDSDFRETVTRLTEEVERLKSGYQGACYACEPVGELNLKLTARVAELEADFAMSLQIDKQKDAEITRLEARVKKLEAALLKVTDALNQGRIVPRRGVSGVGGMTIDAQLRASVYTDVPVGPIEDAIEILHETRAALSPAQEYSNG
jgi:archaellum component FlaC